MLDYLQVDTDKRNLHNFKSNNPPSNPTSPVRGKRQKGDVSDEPHPVTSGANVCFEGTPAAAVAGLNHRVDAVGEDDTNVSVKSKYIYCQYTTHFANTYV